MRITKIIQWLTPIFLLAAVDLSADPTHPAPEPRRGGRESLQPLRPEVDTILLPWEESPDTAGGIPVALAAGDFDENGSVDLAIGVTGSRGNFVAVYSGLSGGPITVTAARDGALTEPVTLFSRPAAFSVPTAPRGLLSGDFDADGHVDLLVASPGEEAIFLLKGDGRGGFTGPFGKVLPGTLSSAVVEDWDRDGLADFGFDATCRGEILAYRFTSVEGAWRALPETVGEGRAFELIPETHSEESHPRASHPFDGVLKLRLNTDAFDDSIAFREEPPTVALSLTRPEALFAVTNTADSGPGSLRQAILDANASPGADAVAFAIGTGSQTIAPLTPLPIITQALTLDATTQPGYSGIPLIQLSGALTGVGAIGLDIAGGGTVVRGFAINRFEFGGVQISGPGDSIIEGNFIGTDPGGASGFPNPWTTPNGLSFGVSIAGSPSNRIGGTSAAARNVISANWDNGVSITGAASTGNVMLGNYIGSSVTGNASLGNAARGVVIRDGASNTIGGTAAGSGNVISGNGTIPPGADGVLIRSANSTLVQGNLIGVDASGLVALPNTGGGIRIRDASSNRIGGTVSSARNVISANLGDGIEVRGNSSTLNLIQGNVVGAASDGTSPLPNGVSGILLTSGSGNSIGGASGAGNQIAFNIGAGILAVAGTGNTISGNAIASNGGLGIDLGTAGVTPNDAGDADAGPNNLQNFPILTVSTCGASTTIQGTLNSSASTTFTLEFFSSPTCDASGNGEGTAFLGSSTVVTDGFGNAAFSVNLTSTAPPGHFVTATATAAGSTSEFSACQIVTGPLPAEVTNLLWVAGSTAGFQWTPKGGALSYSLHRGDLTTLPMLANSMADSCLRWTGTGSTTGEILTETPSAGSFYWYVVIASTTCGEGSAGVGLILNSTGPCL